MRLKTMSSAKSTRGEDKSAAATRTTMGGASVSRSTATASLSPPSSSCAANTSDVSSTRSSCSCLARLAVKLKKLNRMLLLRHKGKNRHSSFQCLYDPLSYSLNFDGSGKGSVLDREDEDYYRFYAFSSRFVMAGSRSIAA